MALTHPEFGFIYAVPNGGYRTKTTGAKMKAEGQEPGVPDLHWPYPSRGFHGLYIEVKATRNGRTSDHQKRWLRQLRQWGHRAVVAKGFDEAQAEMMWYAGLSETKSDAKEVE